MPPGLEPARIEVAANRFRAFFQELNETFVERENVLNQIALALLCKEHALMTGPPGTAKSQLATAVFGRILCESSGKPSVYARQITESTVQTDLIGPVDFKHLMDTGRTVHFTDEGMLGAVHAFLDEVFDGRDMLLRSALNVLQERELKQGTTIIKGRIECALMTSNRYVADVIEQSRETLLAFVDRIAFVSFVPRGFADPSSLSMVLDRHVAGCASSALDALLTIQDLDVLQALVARVVVAPQICASLAQLLSELDAEINAAVRADPSFVPTRYLSTRTAVRSGNVLRAACGAAGGGPQMGCEDWSYCCADPTITTNGTGQRHQSHRQRDAGASTWARRHGLGLGGPSRCPRRGGCRQVRLRGAGRKGPHDHHALQA